MATEKSIFEELAPYAKMVVVPGVTVGNLTYSNQQDLYSTSVISSGATGIIAANTRVPFFSGAQNESAITQGYSGGTLTVAQTNSKFSKGQAPANQVYVATHCGFQLSRFTNTAAATNLPDLSAAHRESLLLSARTNNAGASNIILDDCFTIAQNFAWQLTIGRGITRTIGTLAEYTAPGVYAVQDAGPNPVPGVPVINDGLFGFSQLGTPCGDLRKLEVPVIFPPLVNVNIEAVNGGPVQLIQSVAAGPQPPNPGGVSVNVQIKMFFRGYLMTMPVG